MLQNYHIVEARYGEHINYFALKHSARFGAFVGNNINAVVAGFYASENRVGMFAKSGCYHPSFRWPGQFALVAAKLFDIRICSGVSAKLTGASFPASSAAFCKPDFFSNNIFNSLLQAIQGAFVFAQFCQQFSFPARKALHALVVLIQLLA
jgi:hypothetical protein